MLPSLTQEELTQYASDALTIQEPTGANYSQGVKAGRTIPAKWWNWLFSAATKRIVQARSDADNMLTEMKNVVTDAGLTPDATDDTQLSQAVDIKAEAKAAEFVENKKAFLTMWYGIDTTITIDGYTLELSTPIENLNDKLIWGIFKDIANDKVAICTSTDGYDWAPIEVGGSYLISAKYYNDHGKVAFNGYWFIYVSFVAPSGYQYFDVILRSDNGVVWEQIPTSTVYTAGSSVEGGAIFTADSTLFIQTRVSGLFYSSDGVNISSYTSSRVITVGYSTGVNISRNAAYTVYRVATNKYLIGTGVFDTANLTYTESTSSSTRCEGYYDGNTVYLNGKYAVVYGYYRNNAGRYGALALLDASTLTWTVTLPATDNERYSIYKSVDDYVFKEDFIAQQEYYSSDGVNFTALPIKFYVRVKLGIKYLLVDSDNDYAIYSIEGALSNDINDYVLVNSTGHGNIVPAGISDYLLGDVSYNGYEYYLSLSKDGGATWLPSYMIDGSRYINPVRATIGNKVFTQQAYSAQQINGVIGNTLYLR